MRGVLISFDVLLTDIRAGPSLLITPLHFVPCRYEWIVSQWSKCSSPCNGGNQTRTTECRGLLTGVKVNSSLCSRVRPKTKQECNVHSCSADWIVGNWSKV